MGDVVKGGDKDWAKVQARGILYKAVVQRGAAIWEGCMGVDEGLVKITRVVPSLGSQRDCGDDG